MTRPEDGAGPEPRQGLAVALAGLALTVWTLYHLVLLWGTWPPDLAAIYIAGYLWDTGAPALIYAAPAHFFGGAPPDWAPVIARLGGPDGGAFPFIYPPAWAAIMAPLTRVISAQGFFNAAFAVQLPLVALCIPLARRIAGSRMHPLKWALLGIVLLESATPFYSAINQAQPTILVCLLILIALERSLAGAPRMAGSALALAAAIKITPVIFAILFITRRDWRALGWCALTGAAFLAADVAICGLAPNLWFLAALKGAASTTLISPVNVSARALTDFWLALAAQVHIWPAPNLYIFELPAWLRHLSTLANLGLWLILGGRILLAAQGLDARPRMMVSALALSTGLFLFGPLGWQHYYLLPLVLLPGLATIAPPWAAAVAAFPALVGENIFLFTGLLSADPPPSYYVCLAVGGWIGTLLLTDRLVRRAVANPAPSARNDSSARF